MAKKAPAVVVSDAPDLSDAPAVEMVENTMVVAEADAAEDINPDDPRAAIYAKRDEQLKAQAGDTAIAGDQEAKSEKTAKSTETPSGNEISVVVNGKEKLVAKSRIDAAGGVAAYQKLAAASELLNQTTADARRLREQELHFQERERQLLLREQQYQSAKTAEPSSPDALKQVASEYHEAILDGNIDRANELLVQIQATRNATVGNKEEVAREAVRLARSELERDGIEAARSRFEAERQEAILDFQDRFPDVADDPRLRAMADSETIALLEAHPNWSPKVIITEAAQSVRKWITERTAISSSDQKLATKRGQDSIRGGSAVAALRPAAPPQTKSNYVETLRKQRGLE